MIDTIILRLHNINKYERAIKVFEMNDKNGTTAEIIEFNKSDIDKAKKPNKDPTQILKILTLKRTGKFLVKTKSAKKINSSGNYRSEERRGERV